MISSLRIFDVYQAMARHAAEAQRISATNIARANEPGFKANEIESFSDFMARTQSMGATLNAGFKVGPVNTPSAPNGNNVSLEREIFSSAEAMSQHNLALTVYAKSLDLLRTAMGKRA